MSCFGPQTRVGLFSVPVFFFHRVRSVCIVRPQGKPAPLILQSLHLQQSTYRPDSYMVTWLGSAWIVRIRHLWIKVKIDHSSHFEVSKNVPVPPSTFTLVKMLILYSEFRTLNYPPPAAFARIIAVVSFNMQRLQPWFDRDMCSPRRTSVHGGSGPESSPRPSRPHPPINLTQEIFPRCWEPARSS